MNLPPVITSYDQTLSNGLPRRRFLVTCGASAVPAFLSACAPAVTVCNPRGWSIPLKPSGSFFDCQQISLLSDVANLLVGDGDWPSAEDAGVIPYLDTIFGSWAGTILKARISRLPGQIDRFAIQRLGRSYAFLDHALREGVLIEYDNLAFAKRSSEASIGYLQFKQLVLKIYGTSELTNRDFVRVPGNYLGNISAEQLSALLREQAEGLAR